MDQRVMDLQDARTVRSARVALSRVRGADGVQVEVDGGVARLHGAVPSGLARSGAITAVRGVPGVRAVDDGLRLEADGTEPDDQRIATDAETVLRALGPEFDGVRVDVDAGVVVLDGLLDGHALRIVAVAAVRRVPGVRDVLSGIVLRTHPAAGRLRRVR
ncbi:BON domain-containing protein [Amnibacterium kyonggiense]|uniref:BON domain-containing protein n=1 Tax=Amnibacterium kyonggiense TaxID=595671 RepID=A0A4R7FKL9_9MICO|nr:BON domain-containing protein [Amnibacterium kyonggiense]TDS76889.1 BON domain-containing protein [Amnibacterium kyonggiense]